MYNDLVKKMLAKISLDDAKTFPDQKKYSVEDNFSTLEIYVKDGKVSFRVFGDGYILAMMKWLQIQLQSKQNISNISLESLISLFELPELKYRNALQIVELIEKINERPAI